MDTVLVGTSNGRGHLLRVLGLGFGIALGLGATIGGGILRTPGSVADQVPLAWLALTLWALAAVHALLGANIVSEVMTSVPKSGGLFNVARRAFGDFGALIVGWTDWLIGIGAVAALSIACAEFLGIIHPPLRPYLSHTAVAVAMSLFVLNWLGVREGSFAQMLTSAVKAILLLLLIGAIFLLRPEASTPPVAPAVSSPLTFFGLVVAYQFIFGAYSGWTNPAYFAEEDTNPSRNIPRAMFMSILAVGAIYLLMNAALFYALPVERLRTAELPVAVAISDIFGDDSMRIVAAVAVVTVVGCINATIMVSTRVFHGLGKEGFLPAVTSHVNQGGTPDVAMAVTAFFAVLLALSGTFETVFLIVGALGIFMLAFIDLAFFKLRIAEPELARPYRAIGYPWLPIAVLVLDFGLLAAFLAADPVSGGFMIAAMVICIPVSLWTRRRHLTAPKPA